MPTTSSTLHTFLLTLGVGILSGCADRSRTQATVAPPARAPEGIAGETVVVGAIQAYLATTRSGDFGALYDRHFHSAAKARTGKEQFVQRMQAGFAATFEQLCAAILTAYDGGGLRKGTLTIGPMQYPLVPGTIAVELPRKKPDRQEDVIQPGNAFRIQIAPDPKELRFYDID